jgi:hypothetical protein
MSETNNSLPNNSREGLQNTRSTEGSLSVLFAEAGGVVKLADEFIEKISSVAEKYASRSSEFLVGAGGFTVGGIISLILCHTLMSSWHFGIQCLLFILISVLACSTSLLSYRGNDRRKTEKRLQIDAAVLGSYEKSINSIREGIISEIATVKALRSLDNAAAEKAISKAFHCVYDGLEKVQALRQDFANQVYIRHHQFARELWPIEPLSIESGDAGPEDSLPGTTGGFTKEISTPPPEIPELNQTRILRPKADVAQVDKELISTIPPSGGAREVAHGASSEERPTSLAVTTPSDASTTNGSEPTRYQASRSKLPQSRG